MVHHWRASDHLEASFRAGEWRLYDRGYLIGYIQSGRINGKPGLRGLSSQDELLGYAETLEDASNRLWEWYRRTGRVVRNGLRLENAPSSENQPQDRSDH